MITKLDVKSAASARGLTDITIRNLFILPTIAFLIIFNIFPLIYSLGSSFYDYSAARNAAAGFRRSAELSRPAGEPVHLEQFLDYGQICARLGRRSGDRRIRHCGSAQPGDPVQRPDHHAAAVADDDVGSRSRAVLAAAVQSVMGTHQLYLRPWRFPLAVRSHCSALRGGDHRHLDVVAVRHAALARRPVGGAETSV